MRQTTDREVRQIVRLRREVRMSIDKIARETGRHRTTVIKVLKNA